VHLWKKDMGSFDITQKRFLTDGELRDESLSRFELEILGQESIMTEKLFELFKKKEKYFTGDVIQILNSPTQSAELRKGFIQSALFTSKRQLLAVGGNNHSLLNFQIKQKAQNMSKQIDLYEVEQKLSYLLAQYGKMFRFIQNESGIFSIKKLFISDQKKPKKKKKKKSAAFLYLVNKYDFAYYGESYNESKGIIFFLCLVFTFIVAWVSYILMTDTVRPLKYISLMLTNLSKGRFNFVISYKQKDEIGEFVDSINTTIKDLGNYVEHQSEELEKKAEKKNQQEIHRPLFGQIRGKSEKFDISVFPRHSDFPAEDSYTVVYTSNGIIGAMTGTKNETLPSSLSKYYIKSLLDAYSSSSENIQIILQNILGAIQSEYSSIDRSLFLLLFGMNSETGDLYYFIGQKNNLFFGDEQSGIKGIESPNESLDLIKRLADSKNHLQKRHLNPGSFFIVIGDSSLEKLHLTNPENMKENICEKALADLKKRKQKLNSRLLTLQMVRNYHKEFKKFNPSPAGPLFFSAIVIRYL
jgi:methyl-accepting chemotaxis protein